MGSLSHFLSLLQNTDAIERTTAEWTNYQKHRQKDNKIQSESYIQACMNANRQFGQC